MHNIRKVWCGSLKALKCRDLFDILPSFPSSLPPPACLPPSLAPLKDGNLVILEEELNMEDVDLEEPSYGDIPYTPLFIAYLNDHYQVRGVLMCIMYFALTVFNQYVRSPTDLLRYVNV